jgi:hypothetical protein
MNIPYNIGDFIRSKRYRENGWNNIKNYAKKFCEKYPGSICEKYYLLNLNDKQTDKTYYDDDNINYKLLRDITIKKKIDNNIYIHLRIGDVIDNLNWRPIHEHKDYKDFLIKQQIHWNGCKYVYPLKYYIDIEQKIANTIGKNNTITIIAYKYDINKESNSYKYTMIIYHFFVYKGYNVEITYNNDIDAEFILLCNSKYFIKSLGGFSFLINKIRSIKN